MNDTGRVLEVSDVWKSYGEDDTFLSILRGVNLAVSKGQVAAIMGPSGSGKSTFLHVAGLLDRPDRGTVRILGEDAWEAGESRRAVIRNRSLGFVFQFHHLLDEFTLLENVAMPALLAGTGRSEALRMANQPYRWVSPDSRARARRTAIRSASGKPLRERTSIDQR